jgi:hypothetical protein
MVGAEKHEARGEPVLRAVCERRRGTGHLLAAGALGGEKALVCDPPEHHDDAEARQEGELSQEIASAGLQLGRRRPVLRRRTARHGGDEDIAEDEAVVAADRRRLVREPGGMQRGVEPVAALVAGEHAPRPVAAVRRRGEPDDEHAGAGIAEGRDGSPPVAPVAKARDLRACRRLAMGNQAGAEPAADEAPFQPREPATRHRGRRR